MVGSSLLSGISETNLKRYKENKKVIDYTICVNVNKWLSQQHLSILCNKPAHLSFSSDHTPSKIDHECPQLYENQTLGAVANTRRFSLSSLSGICPRFEEICYSEE